MLGAPYCKACATWLIPAEFRNGSGWACPKCGKHGSSPSGIGHGTDLPSAPMFLPKGSDSA